MRVGCGDSGGRRWRRLVVALTTVAIVVSVLRHQAVRQAERAAQQARLAQASKLVALGRNQIDAYPTAALAYARKSLEVADTAEARRLALEALWRGPTVRVLPMASEAQHWVPDFSPDGEWLATAGPVETVSLFRADGTLARTIRGLEVTAEPRWVKFDAGSRRLATAHLLGGPDIGTSRCRTERAAQRRGTGSAHPRDLLWRDARHL